LAFDFARPLIAGAAGARTAILHVAMADPAQPGQPGAQPGVFVLNGSGGVVHEKESSRRVNRAVYIPPYETPTLRSDARLPGLDPLSGPHESPPGSSRAAPAPGHPGPARTASGPLPARRAAGQAGHRPPEPRAHLFPAPHLLGLAVADAQPQRALSRSRPSG